MTLSEGFVLVFVRYPAWFVQAARSDTSVAEQSMLHDYKRAMESLFEAVQCWTAKEELEAEQNRAQTGRHGMSAREQSQAVWMRDYERNKAAASIYRAVDAYDQAVAHYNWRADLLRKEGYSFFRPSKDISEHTDSSRPPFRLPYFRQYMWQKYGTTVHTPRAVL